MTHPNPPPNADALLDRMAKRLEQKCEFEDPTPQPSTAGEAVDFSDAGKIADRIDRVTRGASSNYLFAGAGRALPIPENQCITTMELLIAAAALRHVAATPPAVSAPAVTVITNDMVEAFQDAFDLDRPASTIGPALEAYERARTAPAASECDHVWVSGDNERVKNCSVCLKCHAIVPTNTLFASVGAGDTKEADNNG